MRAAGVKLGSACRGCAEPICALRDQVGALSAPDGVPAGLRKRLSVTLNIAGRCSTL